MQLNSGNYLQIDELLNAQELSAILNLINQAGFSDGKSTASDAAAGVKQNKQISAESNFQAQQIAQIVSQAISRNKRIQSAILPKVILPPLVSLYEPGMHYGTHVDSPLMGTQFTIRTDVGMTLFLSPPESYEGGELEVITEAGIKLFKPAAGSAVIYPTTRLHQVLPVTNGKRMAVVTWMQCAIRNPGQREIIDQINQVLDQMGQAEHKETRLVLQQVYSNLIRMWAEL
ncbi:PKHD-type hydroxylase [Roseivirga pacifica]|uniref:PKHD-type hydroxylase n=1 Tax=Roseivirga pacifica TaxID=1267423 RepID=A0A1I0P872_9BACT|nr:Fe2+-dependent dioxygenase [Roseivirga pacifica]RKQ51781.1 PKHD-type hydroxylase [Roseivirga pacifica]SEW10401.1 PKHD-type hydroxylase [Roseivirga pacifica]